MTVLYQDEIYQLNEKNSSECVIIRHTNFRFRLIFYLRCLFSLSGCKGSAKYLFCRLENRELCPQKRNKDLLKKLILHFLVILTIALDDQSSILYVSIFQPLAQSRRAEFFILFKKNLLLRFSL